jgi:hypothetical protein
MSELASYSIQATILAVIALIAVSRSKKTDLYQVVLISIWLVGVIAIYARYGEGQVLFYSNDQLFHKQVIEVYLPVEGFRLSAFIPLRYLLLVPIYLVSLTGINALLLNKFIQLLALIFLYRSSKQFLISKRISIRFWHLPLITGPILIFMSLLSLRDVILAFFAIGFITTQNVTLKAINVLGAFLLRPHLGAALLFGYLISEILFNHLSRLPVVRTALVSLISYSLGTISYWFGAVIQQGVSLTSPNSVFTQFKFSQLAANLLGLQFLGLNDPDQALVASTTTSLLLSRLIIFDTILIPILFLAAIFRHPDYLTKQKVLTLQAFLFFYGVVSQTTWNSTRQNIPFLACMGVLAVADIEYFRNLKRNRQPQLLSTSS